jgi:hypothetical protein
MDLQLFGLTTISAPYTLAAFFFMGLLLVAALSTSLIHSVHRKVIERSLFWIFGFVLCVFAMLRPYGLALDDHSYLVILNALCPAGDCSNGSPIFRDYVWFGLVSLGLSYWPDSLDVALVLSGLGVFIKLFVIDRLCRQRLLALLLLVPLSFIQYDMTQLRAGFASAWMMLGIYWLVRSHVLLGGLILLSNFLMHSQGIFSPGLLAYRLLRLNPWIFPSYTVILLGLIYLGLCPDSTMLSWLGLAAESATYFVGLQEGNYDGMKVFPWGYLPILGYGVWLWSTAAEEHKKISNIVAVSLLLGLALAWFFTIIPVIQTRLFDFYTLPLVFLAGNVGNSRFKTELTCLLALVLYLRLELVQDWILG